MPARTDNVTDPRLAAALLLMRRGQAYWARTLAELPDDQFDEPSLLPGWSRRHLVAHVRFNARAVARLVEWARTGVENPMGTSDTQRAEEIEFGATMPVEALRHLAAHAAVHLDVEWRDLPEEASSHHVRTAQGRLVPAPKRSGSARARCGYTLWILATGRAFGSSLPSCTTFFWRTSSAFGRAKGAGSERGIVLEPIDRDLTVAPEPSGRAETRPPLVVRGAAADLVAWGIGRNDSGVAMADGGPPPPAPHWL